MECEDSTESVQSYHVDIRVISRSMPTTFFSSKRSGVNFTITQRAAFKRTDPKSAKKTVKLSSFIALLGSARLKAAHRTLVKLTPDDGTR